MTYPEMLNRAFIVGMGIGVVLVVVLGLVGVDLSALGR